MQEIAYNIFGIVGTQQEIMTYFLVILAGMLGGLFRVFFDHKDDLKQYFALNETGLAFVLKFIGAALVGGFIGYLTYPSIYGAFATGYLSAYSFRLLLARLGVSEKDFFKYATVGLNTFLKDNITKEVMKVDGIRSVQIIDPKDGSGKIYVIVDSEDKPMPQDRLDAVDRVLDKYDLFGIDYQAIQPDFVKVKLSGKLFVTDESRRPQIQVKVEQAIEGYFKKLLAGESVIKSQIILQIYKAAEGEGFQDFNIMSSTPEFTEGGIIKVKNLDVITLEELIVA